MKRNTIQIKLIASVITLAVGLCVASCVETIDQGNRYTFIGNTIASFLEEHEEVYSDFIYILDRGGKFSLMKAYGTYTCFAPTNDAIKKYLFEQDSIYQDSRMRHEADGKSKIIWTGITSPNLEDLSDSMCVVIAQTHLLPQNYLTTEMEGDVIPTMNLNDRFLTLSTSSDSVGKFQLFVNGALVIASDEVVQNGIVHTIADVLNPSSNTVPAQIEDMPFLSIFSEALEKTKLTDKLQDYKDFSYVDGEKTAGNFDGDGSSPYPLTKYYGFTAFVEPDAVFQAEGIYDVNDLYSKCKEWYPEATNPDFTSPDNALNKFIAYHLVNKKLLYTRIVCYNIQQTDFSSETNLVKRSDRYEYYETFQHTLLKVTRPLSNAAYQTDVLVNYSRDIPTLGKPYDVKMNGIPVNIKILDPSTIKADPESYPNYNNEAINGTIQLLQHILVYNEDVMSGYVLNETMRFDFSSLVPEFTNNNIRWCPRGQAGILNELEYFIPKGYGSTVVFNTEETRLYYLCPQQTWHNYQGDEMMALGAFDFKYKLPPVPEGTYELRMGYSANNNRHIVQFYVDDEVTGIPVDLRILLSDPNIGYVSDSNTDDNGIANDKEMKNRGYLKGPTTYYYNGSTLARNDNSVVRKVITTKYLGKGDHWLRFKNVKEDDNGKAQFMHDYLEIVPVGWMRREDISLEDKRK
ncbi:MAG: fasciclin domain-containing protein [Bacteroidaceae bacterium]|nr:fasciclin domain-containing protein [Bacteroidaceae bacterium]